MTDQLAFDPSPVLGVFADVLNLDQLDAIANRCAFAAMTHHDAGMVLADLIIAAGEARETDAGPTWFAYVATAEVLARYPTQCGLRFPSGDRAVGRQDFLRQVRARREIVQRTQAQSAMMTIAGVKLGLFTDEYGSIFEEMARQLAHSTRRRC